MKKVTKSRLNAIQNAGTWLTYFDFSSELSDSEIEDMNFIGNLLIKYDKEVLNLLLKLSNEFQSKENIENIKQLM